MTKKQGTNKEMMRYYEEIQIWKRDNSVNYHFNYSKIREFEKMNGIRIQGIFERMKKIDMDCYKHTMDGNNPVFEFEGEGKDRKPVLNEGKTEQDHTDAYKVLLEEEVTIYI